MDERKPKRPLRPTQEDVARVAGVTRATVSLVLNDKASGHVKVSARTRARVLKAVQQVRYTVNMNARSLKTNRTQIIAILVRDLSNPFYPMLIRGAQEEAQKAGYGLMVFDSFGTAAGEQRFLDVALRHVADGLLVSAVHLTGEDYGRLAGAQVPCVGFLPDLSARGFDVVIGDEEQAVQRVVDHLISRGHTRIAHLTGDLGSISGRIRRDAYRKALAARGIPRDRALEVRGTFMREGIADLVEAWYFRLAADRRPTALFAANDVMALEVMRRFKRRGIAIPGQLAVCGLDDIPEAEYVEPTLTTVDFDGQGMGRIATRLLLERIEGVRVGGPVVEVHPSTLHVRESS